MSFSSFLAEQLSQAFHFSWDELDKRLNLPSVVVRQIDSLRPLVPVTLPVRKYFEATLYERFLLSGRDWNKSVRYELTGDVRSRYLDWLQSQEFGESDYNTPVDSSIGDPAYWMWARLKYANAGSEKRVLWQKFLRASEDAAIGDCGGDFSSLPMEDGFGQRLGAKIIFKSFSEALEEVGLKFEIVKYASAGKGFRVPLLIESCYLECMLVDLSPLQRRVVPFTFKVGLKGDSTEVVLGQNSIWPGCSGYSNVCVNGDLVTGLVGVWVAFMESVVGSSGRSYGSNE